MGERVNNRLRVVLCASVAIVMVLTVLPSMQSSFSDNEKWSVPGSQTERGLTVTATKSVTLTDNQPPVISIQSSQLVNWKTNTYFTATASDADNDTLRFTWDWGDGSKSVTTTPTNVTHVYGQKTTFNLYVYADDLTGLPDHNVSALDVVRCLDLGPSPPYGLTLIVNRSSIWVSQSVTFAATAKDPAGDGMRFSIACGDGTFVNVDTPATGNNAVVTVTASHTYMSAGTMNAHLYVTDGLSNTTLATPVTVTVTLNSPPSVTPLTPKTAWAGSSISFTATAVDPDGDSMRYTWDFGDGTPLQAGSATTHIYAKAGRYTFTVYVNDLTGLAGHNVTSSATASVAFNLPLAVGWNLISVPVVGFGYKSSTLGLATGDMVVAWNSSQQRYDPAYIKGISPLIDDFPIAPNTGYWIWVAAAKTLHLYGTVPTTTQTKAFTVPSSGGWMLAGFVGLNTSRHASNIFAIYSGPLAENITLVAKYGGSTWICAVMGLPYDYMLVPGLGYFCWAEASGTLSYMP